MLSVVAQNARAKGEEEGLVDIYVSTGIGVVEVWSHS